VTLIAVAAPGSLSLTHNFRFILLFETLIFPFVLCIMVVLVDRVIPLFAGQAGPQTRHNSIPRCSRLRNAVLAHSFAIVFDCQ
jgi:hypothetical protein